jgi:hypothetical protein
MIAGAYGARSLGHAPSLNKAGRLSYRFAPPRQAPRGGQGPFDAASNFSRRSVAKSFAVAPIAKARGALMSGARKRDALLQRAAVALNPAAASTARRKAPSSVTAKL